MTYRAPPDDLRFVRESNICDNVVDVIISGLCGCDAMFKCLGPDVWMEHCIHTRAHFLRSFTRCEATTECF